MRKCILVLFIFYAVTAFSQKDYARYVNPFIGTGGHGHTFPGATVPFGMVQLSPDTRIDKSWDGSSGYHYSDNVIYGFSHTHLNGTGVSDYGDIMLMPGMGEPNLNNASYSSTFSHNNETATAGYYAVKLNDNNIKVELTATPRVGMHQYTFSEKGQANIILDLNHRDKLLMGEVRIIDNTTIEVLRRSEAWASNQYIYARIEFSKPVAVTAVNNNAFAPAKTTDTFFAGSVLALSFSTDVKKNEKLLVKVALSPTGYEGAAKNMKAELPGWKFKKTKKAAEKLWNKELSKIQVKQSGKEKRTIFYTALYHTMMQPNIAMDVDGRYRGRDNEIHTAEGFDYYTVFSLWDTFRAAHPLYTLIDKKRTADYINTFIKQYEQGGRLPVWELACNETDCMIGYHAVSVIADAMVKGIDGFDYEKAYEASRHSAMLNHYGLDAYKFQGYIGVDDEHESVSKTVEYAYDDWCIAQMASILGKEDDYKYFMRRSQNWKNIFDPETKHMRPKKNGGWQEPFDAREVSNDYTEGNSWQYSFFVPQDIYGMIEAYGGNADFEAKLDEMFNALSRTTGREQADVTGLIGQYAHGNEPSHHMAYLYNYVGKSEKTKEKVHYILNNFYKNTPDGLIGNEDCGQMSAWYVLSSMGIYPVAPGSNKWDAVTPYFNKIIIRLEDGTSRKITKQTSRQKLRFLDTGYEHYADENVEPIPISPDYDTIVAVPVVEAAGKTFEDSITVNIKAPFGADIIYYIINTNENENESRTFTEYKAPFKINNTAEIRAYIEKDRKISQPITANFYKKPNDYIISIKSKYNSQYHAGGPEGLLDGIYGEQNWRKGEWQGYQGQDFEAVIDLKKQKPVTNIAARFLQDSRSWILMPDRVEFYASDDNENFRLIDTVNNIVAPKDETVQAQILETFPEAINARYIKVKAYNYGTLPDWHQGHGGEAFIFIDEITVE